MGCRGQVAGVSERSACPILGGSHQQQQQWCPSGGQSLCNHEALGPRTMYTWIGIGGRRWGVVMAWPVGVKWMGSSFVMSWLRVNGE